jgi:hypothetical protein
MPSFEHSMEARPINKQLTKDEDDVDEKVFISDFIAQTTQYARKSTKLMVTMARRFESTVGYK